MKKNVTVIGHRGIAAAYPENTLISFEKAVEAGVDAIEFDVHMTRDEQLVVTHDPTVNRCSNGTGDVNSYTLNQLKALDFGKWKSPEFAGTRIPTLDETLDAIHAKRPELFLLVELKDDREACTRMVLDVLRRRNLARQQPRAVVPLAPAQAAARARTRHPAAGLPAPLPEDSVPGALRFHRQGLHLEP